LIAAEVCERAFSSMIWPSMVSEMMTTAASKYTATRPIATNDSGNTPGHRGTNAVDEGRGRSQADQVHMFGLRWTIDCQPRTKNGQPVHSTTGSDSTRSALPC
jgi:hypothetical protein